MNGRQKKSESAMSGRTSGGLGVGRDGRASRVQGEVEAGRSGHTQAAGRSLARAGGHSQVQSAACTRSSSGRSLVRSDRMVGHQGRPVGRGLVDCEPSKHRQAGHGKPDECGAHGQ